MAMMLPIIIAAKVIGPLIANVENALTPWPIEQPIAITLPNSIKTAPTIWRPHSRPSSHASHLKFPLILLSIKAPAITPTTLPNRKIIALLADDIIYSNVFPSGAVNG